MDSMQLRSSSTIQRTETTEKVDNIKMNLNSSCTNIATRTNFKNDFVDTCNNTSLDDREQLKANSDESGCGLQEESLTSSRGYGSLKSLECVTVTDAAIQRRKVEEINDLIRELDIDPAMYLSPRQFHEINCAWNRSDIGALTVKKSPSVKSEGLQTHPQKIVVN